MNVALREGNNDAVLGERCHDHGPQIAGDQRRIDLHDVHPKAELEHESALGEFGEKDLRFWLFFDEAVAFSHFAHQLHNAARVRSVGDSDGDRKADLSVRVGPICDIVLEQVAVWYKRLCTVPQFKHRRSKSNARDDPSLATDIENVTNAEGAFEEDDQPADEILQQRLHAESQADRQRATGESEYGQWNFD